MLKVPPAHCALAACLELEAMQKAPRALRPRWLLPVTVVVLLSVVAGSAGAYQASRIPPVEEQVPSNATPLVVTLSTPPSGATFPADAVIGVRAKAAAYRPLAALELWADGMLVQRQEAPARGAQTTLDAYWSWQPPGQGVHTLVARAIDSEGALGQSAATRVQVAAPVGASSLVVAQPGDTLESLAEEAGVAPDDLAAENPALEPGQEIPPGEAVYVPQAPPSLLGPTPTPTPLAGPLLPELGGLSKVDFWIQGKLSPAGEPPAAPAVTASVQGCEVRLAVSDQSSSEEGFFIYRLAPNASAFQRIATLGANGSNQPFQYVDQQASGHVEYYVSAFNAAGESPSAICPADVDSLLCVSKMGDLPLATGDLRIVDGRLVVAEPYDRVYYYLSVDKGPWTRVPPEPDAFIPPMPDAEALKWAQGLTGSEAAGIADDIVHGKAHVYDLLAPLGGLAALQGNHALSLELWGWLSGTLIHLGDYATGGGTMVVGTAEAGGWLPLASSQTVLKMCGRSGSCTEGLGWTTEALVPWSDQDQTRQFFWSTDSPAATAGVWQMTLVKPSGGFDPAPAGLVASGTQAGKGGTFKIDFSKVIVLPGAPAPTATPPALVERSQLELVFGSELKLTGPLVVQALEAPLTYYVRITPMDGNQPAGQPSQVMTIHQGPKPDQESPFVQPPPTIHDVEIVGLRPVVFQHLRWGCTEIIRNDYYGLPCGSESDACLTWRNIPVGTVRCPAGWKGVGEKPWYEQLWDFCSGAVDYAGKVFAAIKKGFIECVAITVPLCLEPCKGMLAVGVDSSLASMSVPAELPSLATLSGTDQDYMVAFLAQQVGSDCTEDSACMAAIKQGIKQLAQQASAGGTNTACVDADTAHAFGVEPMCLPEGVVGRPATGSQFEPAIVYVKITRRADSPEVPDAEYEKYRLHVYASATNGQDLVGKTVTVPVNSVLTSGGLDCAYPDRAELLIEKPLSASPFAPVSAPVPRLKPGQSIIVPVAMNIVPYWLPGHQELIKKAGGTVCYDDWSYLYFGGTLSVSASVDCVVQMGQTWVNCTSGNAIASAQYALPASWDETPVAPAVPKLTAEQLHVLPASLGE